jgi:predicted nucleic-acid-binding protein
MVAVDTNIVVRFLVRDDRKQAARAASLIRSDQIWIPKTVLLETEWVLRSLYGFSTHSLAEALRRLAGLSSVFLEDELTVAKALDWFEAGLDFAAALHWGSAGSAKQFATFDRKLARRAQQTTSLEILPL